MAVVPQPPVDALIFAELSKIGVVARTGTPVACAVLAAAPLAKRPGKVVCAVYARARRT